MSYIPDTTRFVAQVKNENFGRGKWQFEITAANELKEDTELLKRIIHARAGRIEKEQKDEGNWPAEGNVVVWYAELDSLNRPVKQVDWHMLEN